MGGLFITLVDHIEEGSLHISRALDLVFLLRDNRLLDSLLVVVFLDVILSNNYEH